MILTCSSPGTPLICQDRDEKEIPVLVTLLMTRLHLQRHGGRVTDWKRHLHWNSRRGKPEPIVTSSCHRAHTPANSQIRNYRRLLRRRAVLPFALDSSK